MKRQPTRGRYVRGVTLAATALLASSCAGAPSILEPSSPSAARIGTLWWIMFGIATAVVVVVGVLVVVSVVRRNRRVEPDGEPAWTMRLVVAGGVVLPVIVLSMLWAFTLRDVAALGSPGSEPVTTIEITGYRWWWEVRYPDEDITTANEMHIPAGEPVRVRLLAGDVIHSFWVPELGPKVDMIPGRTNTTWLQADRAGVYRGQCAEFCGLQHANMAFSVIAEEPAAFDEWVTRERQDAAEPTDDAERRGREVFSTAACTACHVIRGVSEEVAPGTRVDGPFEPTTAVEGPDLTHVASRRTIGAGTVPNTRGHLGGWIVDSQTIKPGNLMPPIELSGEELTALLAYLESLE